MVHSYTLGGYNIALDVYSGAVHVLDSLSMEMLPLISPPMEESCPLHILAALSGRYETGEIVDCYEELYSLYRDEQLFSADTYDEFSGKMGLSPIKAMCLHVAHDCNLRCRYCFAEEGEYNTGSRSIMSIEIGKKAIDFLILHSEGRRNLEVDFFGGEPLLNFPLIEEVVSYARGKEKEHGKNFRFTVTTNGMLLDEHKIDFINREMYNVVLSLDGRREVNDNMRVDLGGGGSYDRVLPKFLELVKKRGDGQHYVRGTFTSHNLDFVSDVLSLYNEGFRQISVEPVVAPESADYSIKAEHIERIFAEYEQLANTILEMKKRGAGFNFFHFMLDLSQGPCAIKRLRGCGSGNEYVAVTPDGEVYPCHQFVGKPEFLMGSVLDSTLNTEIKKQFADCTVDKKPVCRDCWAKFYCSGGCNANNYTYGGSLKAVHNISCELERKRVECAVMMKVAELS